MGDCIRRLRLRYGYTQEGLSNMLHISHQAISKWENNETEPPFSTIVAMANLFEISIDKFNYKKEA